LRPVVARPPSGRPHPALSRLSVSFEGAGRFGNFPRYRRLTAFPAAKQKMSFQPPSRRGSCGNGSRRDPRQQWRPRRLRKPARPRRQTRGVPDVLKALAQYGANALSTDGAPYRPEKRSCSPSSPVVPASMDREVRRSRNPNPAPDGAGGKLAP
jgi:hypothetical protein